MWTNGESIRPTCAAMRVSRRTSPITTRVDSAAVPGPSRWPSLGIVNSSRTTRSTQRQNRGICREV